MLLGLSNPINLSIDDELRDLRNRYRVLDFKCENTHSQAPSHYLVVCVEGPYEGREVWAGNNDLSQYRPGGKYYEGYGSPQPNS